jgi:hypothetical protein
MILQNRWHRRTLTKMSSKSVRQPGATRQANGHLLSKPCENFNLFIKNVATINILIIVHHLIIKTLGLDQKVINSLTQSGSIVRISDRLLMGKYVPGAVSGAYLN